MIHKCCIILKFYIRYPNKIHKTIYYYACFTDDSDFEGTSMERLSTSAGSSGGGTSGNKKERHFWQYNVQAKGPKGQKIVINTKMDDPHQLNDIVDPVFSGDVQLQGIKHRYSNIFSYFFHEIKRIKRNFSPCFCKILYS